VRLVKSLIPLIESSGDESQGLSLNVVLLQLLSWTDISFLIKPNNASHTSKISSEPQIHHLKIALVLTEEAISNPPENLKWISSLLNKLKLDKYCEQKDLQILLNHTGHLLKVNFRSL
jgi:hypothetical protein